MAQIDTILNNILTTQYGKDMRQDIHDGIKLAYDNVAETNTAWTKVGDLDISTIGQGGSKSYVVSDVDEILIIWKKVTNSGNNSSSMSVVINNVQFGSVVDIAGSSSAYNGWAIIKQYDGIGINIFKSASSTSSTDYRFGTLYGLYNMYPLTSAITSVSIVNPATSYYATSGTISIYAK